LAQAVSLPAPVGEPPGDPRRHHGGLAAGARADFLYAAARQCSCSSSVARGSGRPQGLNAQPGSLWGSFARKALRPQDAAAGPRCGRRLQSPRPRRLRLHEGWDRRGPPV